ncbi:hypothetical protein SNE40_009324 [Patella caerulea]|uniref:Hexosyltransferase n=1 Tax=Patella caerulea TaxID=87958 RepID=A0AAN8PQ35_PATCE
MFGNIDQKDSWLKRVCCALPRFSLVWHCLSGVFILCLIINGILYLQNSLSPKSHYPGIETEKPKRTDISTERTAETIINPHNYSYILNQPGACHANTVLIMMVCTSMKNFQEREAIRNTWGAVGRDTKSNITVLFLVGSGGSEDLQKQISNESNHYKDIIQESFIDSYRNLSIKSQAMLKWINSFCLTAKYALKTDDDMYVNVPNLLRALNKQTLEKFILGFIFVNAPPNQNKKSKWYTSRKDFSEKTYPRYTSGTAYSMSVKAVPELYKASLMIKLFWLEDIYITGLCARRAKIPQINDWGFHYTKPATTGCAYRNTITGHQNTIQEMYKIHKELLDPKLKC